MTTLIVLNASSGGSKELPVGELLEVAGDGAAVISPRSMTSFRAEVTAAARGADRIVVAGGDGTFNCTLNAFDYRFDSICWGLVPAGTGNDLARTLGLPDDPIEAMKVAVAESTQEIDVGVARGGGTERLFINACMGGFPVQVDEKTNEEMKERFGPFAFWVAGARAAAKLERASVSVNGRELEDCVAVGVGNGKTVGGGIEVFPQADPSDGVLDSCAVAVPGPSSAAKLIPRLMRGTHEGIDEVATDRGSSITIESDPPIELNVDGDLVGLKTPAKFEIAGKLTIAAPA